MFSVEASTVPSRCRVAGCESSCYVDEEQSWIKDQYWTPTYQDKSPSILIH